MSLCRLLRVPAGRWPFPALSPRIFPQMLAPIPRWSSWCIYPFLPRRHRPSSRRDGLGTSQNIHTATSVWEISRGYSDSFMFRPPGLLATQIAPTAACLDDTLGSRGFLRPRISRFVTSPSRGYASRPNRATDGMGTFTPQDSRPCWPLPRRYLCESFPACLDPYPGCSCGAFTRFFPQDFGLPHVLNGSALGNTRTATSVRILFRSCSHSLMFRPAGLLATQVAPTSVYVFCVNRHVHIRVRWAFQGFRLGPQSDSHSNISGLHPLHRAAMAFTSEQYTSCCLPVLRIC